jgi:manganese/zinc/iron transport system permease protein
MFDSAWPDIGFAHSTSSRSCLVVGINYGNRDRMILSPSLDFFPLLAAVLAAATCGLLGNWLVLRRLSLMGDAISHSVLPGIVIAFLVVTADNPLARLLQNLFGLDDPRHPLLIFTGAALAGVLTVVLVEVVKKLGRVESGAAMGVVFSIMFAYGVLLIESSNLRGVDLDTDCVLYGQLETLARFGWPMTWGELLSWRTIEELPRQVTLLLVVFTASLALSIGLFKELRIAAFDPALATTQGVNATAMHYVLMTFIAAATVASFEAVGSVLVIAMLIVPAVVARLLTDRLASQLGVSLLVSVASGVGGYWAATAVPTWLDLPAVNAAGSMTVVAGLLLVVAALVSPSHGLVARAMRRRKLARRSAVDDLLARLLRRREDGQDRVPVVALKSAPGLLTTGRSVSIADRLGLVRREGDALQLTPDGLARATDVVRRHRQWESFLVDSADMKPDHVHAAAEQLEHLPLNPGGTATVDPHGRPIPRDLA